MKYLFEVEEEITECSKCPIRAVGKMNELYCPITLMGGSRWKRPEECPLKKVEEPLHEKLEAIIDECSQITDKEWDYISEKLKEINSEKLNKGTVKLETYHPEKHCGNCEHGNKYKEQEPCNSCKKQSNWKKRIFY